MFPRTNIRKLSLTMVIIMAMVLVAIPVCQMATCGMTGASMAGMSGPGTMLSNACGRVPMGATAPSGIVPPGSQTLILALGLLIMALAGTVFPTVGVRHIVPVTVFTGSSPPDPLGVRLTL